jgi:hypothetical protein
MRGRISASTSMPLIWVMRGFEPAMIVPATERICCSVSTSSVITESWSPERSRVVSSIRTPRSRATEGAATMLMSARIGRSSPATTALVSALVFMWATSPS